MNVTNLLGYQLKQTQHCLRLNMDIALKSINLTTPQYAVLAQLELNPGISNAALARSSYITPQTMHSILRNLEKNNLIKRDLNANHGRILSTTLTELGKNIIKQAHEIIFYVEKKMTISLSEEKKMLFENLLKECFDNLNEKKNKMRT